MEDEPIEDTAEMEEPVQVEDEPLEDHVEMEEPVQVEDEPPEMDDEEAFKWVSYRDQRFT